MEEKRNNKIDSEAFNQLSVEKKAFLMKTQTDLLSQSIRDRMNALPSIATVAAALLIVATFGENYIENGFFLKFVLSSLLFVVYINIPIFIYDLHTAEKNGKKNISKYLGKDIEDLREKERIFGEKLTGMWPFYSSLFVSFIILLIIISIWV